MADITEVEATRENAACRKETKSNAQDPALAAIWEAVVRIERNTSSHWLVNENKALKANLEALQTSLQFTQADVENFKKEN